MDRGSTPLAAVRDRFWSATNDPFFDALDGVSRLSTNEDGSATSERLGTWRVTLEHEALRIFDATAPLQDAASGDVRRVVEGRRFLVWILRGYGPRGLELFKHLSLVAPEVKSKKGEAV